MCHPTRTSDSNFYIRQTKSEITMNKLPQTFLLVYPIQFIQTCSVAISHHTVVCSYYTCKKTKTNDALPIVMFQAFIIDQSNFVIHDRMQEWLVLPLFLFGMRKNQVCFFGYQLLNRHFFYSK